MFGKKPKPAPVYDRRVGEIVEEIDMDTGALLDAEFITPEKEYNVPKAYDTGQTIEEIQNDTKGNGDLRDDIIEAGWVVVKNTRDDDANLDPHFKTLRDAYEVYHSALREQSKEGK